MPTHRARFSGSFFSDNGRYHLFRIYQKNYNGQTIPLKIGSGGVKIKYDTSGQEKFSAIMSSKCTISLIVENNVFGNNLQYFMQSLQNTFEEGDINLVIWNTGSLSDDPVWSGNILIDLSSKEDVSKPYEVELTATDGLGLLKNYDMVKTQGTNPYTESDTYISDGYQTFIYWIKEILAKCNVPDNDSTDGVVSDYKFSTAVNWWYEEHPAASVAVSPLAYTKAQMLGCYEITQDSSYKVKTMYEVLESICKMWGMKVVFWKNKFYFTQLELYTTPDTGDFSNPDNIDTQIWNKDGTAYSSQDFIGNTFYTLYTQNIQTNAGGFDGGLQKLAGSTWDFYPKLKEVTVDYSSVGTNNYYISFPQPNPSEVATATDRFSSTSLGTINDAASLGGFYANIDLYFQQPSQQILVSFQLPWSFRAKPSADPDFSNGYYLPNLANNPTAWEAWPGISSQAFTSQTAGYTNGANWLFLLDKFQNFSHTFSSWPIIYNSGTFNLINQIIPTDSSFTGSWDFEIFTYMTYLQEAGGLGAGGGYIGPVCNITMGGIGPIYQTLDFRDNITTPTLPISYSDIIQNGSPKSRFQCVFNNQAGSTLIVQSSTSNRNETEKQAVKNIFWGDAPVIGDANDLIYDDGAGNTGYTDSGGKWRKGQSGSFDKTITRLLSEARLFSQQTSDYKWNLVTAVSSINDWQTDNTGARPVYINPVGRIFDQTEEIFYYMLRGTFNMNKDEWDAEWVQISYDNGITSTSTTTTTGGLIPSDHTIDDILAPSTTKAPGDMLVLTSLSSGLAAGTVTSLPINMLNPGGANFLSQSNIIKTGDKLLLRKGQYFHEFEASADVSDTATSISVTSTTTTVFFPTGCSIGFNQRDLYKQYQHQDRGSVGGMQVATSQLGPISVDGEGNYTINAKYINGVDLEYIKLIPSDFISNADNTSKYWQFADTGTTGVRISNANTELWAMVAIPYGKKATHVTVWGNNTKDVEAYELDVNASGIGTALGSGTVGTEFSITNLSSDATNYLGVKVITTGTSNRIYGGKVTLANI